MKAMPLVVPARSHTTTCLYEFPFNLWVKFIHGLEPKSSGCQFTGLLRMNRHRPLLMVIQVRC
jgi:hypothetical protein